MTARGWFRVHSFTGVITGLLLFVICWSGTFAVVSNEIDWLVTPEARVVPPEAVRGEEGPETVGWWDMVAAVEATYPEAAIIWLGAPLYPRSAAEIVIDLPTQSGVTVYVDPYTGRVQGAWSYFDAQRFFRSFHMTLFEPLGGGGLYIVCAFAVTLLVSLVASLKFYKRWWRRFLDRPRLGSRAFLSTLHKAVGLWSLWFLIVIGVTGVWYVFEAARADFFDGKNAWAGRGDHAIHQIALPVAMPGADPSRPPLPLDSLIDRARQLRPDLAITGIAPETAAITIEGQSRHILVRNRANSLILDSHTGAVVHDQTPRDYSLYWRWSDTADPLHFGDFAGLTSKLIWFAFGLGLSGLIFTGTLLHARRLAAEAGGDGARASRHRWPGTAAALVVSGLLLALSIPAGFAEARLYYGPVIDGVPQLPALAPGVWWVLAVWITATLALIALWVRLLWRRRPTMRLFGPAKGHKVVLASRQR